MKYRVLLLAAILAALFHYSLSIGAVDMSVFEVYSSLVGGDPAARAVAELRLSRSLTAVAVGAVLGVAGAVLQSVLRNPLASPYTLGIPQAAALGAALGIFVGQAGHVARGYVQIVDTASVVFFAFISALSNALLVLALAAVGGLSPVSIILAMVAVSAVYQSALALLQYLYLNDLQTAAVVYWTFGDVGRTTLSEAVLLVATAAAAVAVFWLLSGAYNLVAVDDDLAKTRGVDPKYLRVATLTLVAFFTAVAVSHVGVIGFVGLAAPNIARPIFGGGHRRLIPASAAAGGALLLAADILGRSLKPPVVIPAGVVMSFIGAAVIVAILMKWRRL